MKARRASASTATAPTSRRFESGPIEKREPVSERHPKALAICITTIAAHTNGAGVAPPPTPHTPTHEGRGPPPPPRGGGGARRPAGGGGGPPLSPRVFAAIV